MIRIADASDKLSVIALLREAHAHHGFNDPCGMTGFVVPFDAAYIERLFLQHIESPNATAIVSDRGGVDGVLMAVAFEHPYGPVRVARDTVFWITPARRGGSAAQRMLDAYEAWAYQQQRCQFAGIGGMGSHPGIDRLMRRRGYRVAETHYLRAA